MALIVCYECEGQVSTLAIACPHCGAPSKLAQADVAAPVPQRGTAALPSGTGTLAIMSDAGKPHIMTWMARAYFAIGGLIATPIMPTQGYTALIAYLAQYLLLGLGVAVMAFGYSREPRDQIATIAILSGWVYLLVVASAIVSANVVRLT
ncbi:MAG: hypothetical protein AAF660_15605 [Pseudomonadota bacterium]